MEAFLEFTPADISAGVIGGLIVALVLAAPILFMRSRRWFGAFNAQWAIKINRAELKRLTLFRGSALRCGSSCNSSCCGPWP